MSVSSFLPEKLDRKDLHQLVIGAVCPRPIALVSSRSNAGEDNLAPYSFFNAISSNPPILMFSVSRGPGARPSKDTLRNLGDNPECVINVVTREISRQMSLCSVAYPHGISEFSKSGLEGIASDLVKPLRVRESPVQFECTVRDIIAFGNQPGAANLVLCDVVKIHIDKKVLLDGRLRIDPWKLGVVGRLGRSYYVHAEGDRIFEMYQPTRPDSLGFDALPEVLKNSMSLTGNQLAELASLSEWPSGEERRNFMSRHRLTGGEGREFYLEKFRELLQQGNKSEAFICAMLAEEPGGAK